MGNDDDTPTGLREGVRSGILSSIRRDVELRGGRTARLLVVAGVVGVAGAIGATLLVSGHPFDHHPPWHVAFFSALWAGLLVVSFAVAFLEIRTPSLPLARSAAVGILGLGLAGICSVACPDPHFLHWWSGTGAGGSITRLGGMALGALCLGLVATAVFGGVSAFLVLADRSRSAVRPMLPAVILLVLLAPGIALQSVGTSLGTFAGWLSGTAAGAYLGVAAGIGARRLVSRS